MDEIEKLKSELKEQKKLKSQLETQLKPINDAINALTDKIREYERKTLFPQICKCIDDIFNSEENKNCNIVILNGVHGDYDGGRNLHKNDDWDESDVMDISLGKYNKWATKVEYSHENFELLNSFYALAKKYVPSSEKLYKSSSSINCVWHGIVALHRNHTIVTFVCRLDNMMSDESLKKPKVLLDFNLMQ